MHSYWRCTQTIHVATANTNHQQVHMAKGTTTDPGRMGYMAKVTATNTLFRQMIVTTPSFRKVATR